jgi:hypothetical protein
MCQEVNVAPNIVLDVWLYGALSRYGGSGSQGSFAKMLMNLPDGSTIRDLLVKLDMKSSARGITFINGKLSAMPGLQPDMEHILCNGDRIAFFDLKSMWPFQYRLGGAMIDEMAEAMHASKDGGLHHAYKETPDTE